MPGWDYRLIVVMRTADANAANLAVPAQLDNNPAETSTWKSCRLSSSGNNPNTYFAMSTAATAAYATWLKNLPATYSNTRWYQYNASDILTATNSAQAMSSIGQPYTITQIMAEVGVKQVAADQTLPPVVNNVVPATLGVLGGAVTINGLNFQDDATVKVGIANLANVVVSADGTKITGTVPALSLGVFGITVNSPTALLTITIPGLLTISL